MIMQIINISLNLKIKNNICSSSKCFGLYGDHAPRIFQFNDREGENIVFNEWELT